MEEAPLLTGSVVKRIDVGYLRLNKDEFKFNTIEEIRLN
jgi:hypothetical protein